MLLCFSLLFCLSVDKAAEPTSEMLYSCHCKVYASVLLLLIDK